MTTKPPGAGGDEAGTSATYAQAIYRAASAAAAAVTERVTLASRTLAVARFEQLWPSVSGPKPTTRRLLQDWYVAVYERHLDQGLAAPADAPIDGNQAEQVISAVRTWSGAPTAVVMDTVLTLARDARALADGVGPARARFVQAGLTGQIAAVFPRQAGEPVGVRQAIAEQWYRRCFHAELDPALYRLRTPPITKAEIAAVADDLTAGAIRRQPRPAHQTAAGQVRKTWRTEVELRWNARSAVGRLLWLARHGHDERLHTRSYTELPDHVQEDLLVFLRTRDRRRPASRPVITSGRPISQAAVAFATDPIPTAGQVEVEAAHILFSRGFAAFPRDRLADPPPASDAIDALSRLKAANTRRRGQMRGLPPVGWWNNAEDLQHAAEMRTGGASWVAIGRMLGVTPLTARTGLVRHSDLAPALTTIQPFPRRWTAEERAAAAALRERGYEWNRIARLIGRPSGAAVRSKIQPDQRRAKATEQTRRDPTAGLDRRTRAERGPAL